MSDMLPLLQYSVSIRMEIYDPASDSRQIPGGLSIGFDSAAEAWEFIRKIRDIEPSDTEKK